MKNAKLIGLVVALSVIAFPLSSKEKYKTRNDLSKLLQLYQADMQKFFSQQSAGDGMGNLQNVFYTDISFAADSQVERFLRQVSANRGNQVGYSQVSFTRFVSVNGDMRAVSFNMVNDGTSVVLTRSTNINGQMLKTIYDYDIKAQKLKTGAFKNNKLFKNNEYSI